ncbi:hypothetical protein [Methylobacterium mesophilicum]
MSDRYQSSKQGTPSPALLARLAHRFRDTPAHANWRARIADSSPTKGEAPPAPAVLPRGGHTELALDRFTHEDARIRRGGGLPAVWSAYS